MPSSNFVDFAAFTVPARELSGNFYLIRRIDENNLAFIIGDCCSIGIKAAYTATVIKTLVDEALRELSGNFYLIRRIDENNLAFIIGDCCSIGIKAAYTATVIKTLVDEALRLSLDPPNMMSYINDRLCEERNVATVGLFISIISEMTGNVIACNAGHTSPIVIDDNGPHFMCEPNDKRLGRNQGETFELSKCYLANNDMVLLYSHSPIVIDDNGPHFMCEPNDKRLGRNQGETFELSKCYLANNDMVLLYSQGIVNVRNSNDELFGMERLLDHCDNSAGLRADELIIRILNDIKQHKGKRPFREDVSLISFKQLERLLDHCDNSAGLRADELIIRILNDIKQHKGKRPFREDVSLISFKQLRIRF